MLVFITILNRQCHTSVFCKSRATCFGLDLDHQQAKTFAIIKRRMQVQHAKYHNVLFGIPNYCKTVGCYVTLDDVLFIEFFTRHVMIIYFLAWWWSISRPKQVAFNPLNPELNPICYLLALLGAHHLLHVSRIRVKLLTFRLLMSCIYGAPILDVSRAHTTTQHGR